MRSRIPALSVFFLLLLPAACTSVSAEEASTRDSCPLTEPVWIEHPEDSAVQNPPAFGYYYVNEDLSIWASARWSEDEEYPLRAGGNGNKMGWFRPAGRELTISGHRLDGDAPPLEAHVPCCYPTRFQASGVYFPTEGCWEVNAKATESELTFIVWVEP
jgi:hypothetical protein